MAAEFGYNADGMRTLYRYSDRGVQRGEVNDNEIRYEYDGNRLADEYYKKSNNHLAHYYYGEGLVWIESREEMLRPKQYVHPDALGSTAALTNDGGAKIAEYDFDPWGNLRGSLPGIEQTLNRTTFTGHTYDPNTGLYYFKARYYDPDVGRFITKDRYQGNLNIPQSLNGYTYAYNNPGVYVDKDGNEPIPYFERPQGTGPMRFDPRDFQFAGADRIRRVSGTGLVTGAISTVCALTGPWGCLAVVSGTVVYSAYESYHARDLQFRMIDGKSPSGYKMTSAVALDLSGANALYSIFAGEDLVTGQNVSTADRIETAAHIGVGFVAAKYTPKAATQISISSTVENISIRDAGILAGYINERGGTITGRVVSLANKRLRNEPNLNKLEIAEHARKHLFKTLLDDVGEIPGNLFRNIINNETRPGVWNAVEKKLTGDIDLHLYGVVTKSERLKLAREINSKIGKTVIDTEEKHGVLPKIFEDRMGPNTPESNVPSVTFARKGLEYYKHGNIVRDRIPFPLVQEYHSVPYYINPSIAGSRSTVGLLQRNNDE